MGRESSGCDLPTGQPPVLPDTLRLSLLQRLDMQISGQSWPDLQMLCLHRLQHHQVLEPA